MTNNVQPVESAVVSSPETEAAAAPSCYRLSVLSGSLEVSARAKNADDLELLLKVLEANKALFTKTDRSAMHLVLKATKTSAKSSRSDGETSANMAQSETNTRTNTSRLTEILTP